MRLAPLLTAALLLAATPAIAKDADPALWVVKDADTTVYMFGTVHVLPAGLDWFDEGVKAAYDASSEVVIEMIAPDPAASAATVMTRAIDPDGPPLSEKLPEAARAPYRAALAQQELPVAAFEQFEPWFVATALAMKPLEALGYDVESGVEKLLSAAARRDGKRLGELETFDQQIGYFDTMPEALQIAFLTSTVEELPEVGTAMRDMVDAWAAGDPERLGALMNESLVETPELAKLLLADRNARWADWIKTRLATPGTVFVAVGAGHLAGTQSVQAMLAERGVTSGRVRY